MATLQPAPRDLGHAPVVQLREWRGIVSRAAGPTRAGECKPLHRRVAERGRELVECQAGHGRQHAQGGGVDEGHAARRIEHQHGIGQQVEKLAPAAGAPPRLERGAHSNSLAVMSARNWARLISATPIISRSAASRKSNRDSLSAASTTSM